MNYGEILKNAWKIIWRNKVLWLFGILAGCMSNGGSSGGNGNIRGLNSSSNEQFENFRESVNLPPWLETLPDTFQHWANNGTIWLVLIGFILLIILLAIINLLLGSLGRLGIVRGVWLAEERINTTASAFNAPAGPLHWGEIMRGSTLLYWRMVLFFILYGIFSFLLGLVMLVLFSIIAIMTLFCGLIVLIPLSILIDWVLQIFAWEVGIGIGAEGRSIRNSVGRAWDTLKSRLLDHSLMALITYLITGITRFIISLPLLIPIVYLAFRMFATKMDFSQLQVDWIAIAIFFAVFIPVIIFLNGVIESFIGAVWVLVFRKINPTQSAGITPPSPQDTSFPPEADFPTLSAPA